MKLPAFQFYPADWRKDPGVQSLSFHDRGVWFEILCLMHESEQRGMLLLNGKPMPQDALGRLLGLSKASLSKTLATLIESGVASREDGAICNRRMVRDEYIRQVRQEAGRLGGNPNLLNQNPTKTQIEAKQKPTPSSPSSSSSSLATAERKDSRRDGKPSKPPDVIWDLGVTMLVNAGWTEPNARSFLGKQSKLFGKTELAQSISATSAANPANPHEYLVKTLQGNKNGASQVGQSPDADYEPAPVEMSKEDHEDMLRRFPHLAGGVQ